MKKFWLLIAALLMSPSLGFSQSGSGGGSPIGSIHNVSVPMACAAASGSGTAYTCSTAPSFTPVSGDLINFKSDVANTASATLAVNGAAAATIKKQGGGTNLVANDLLIGQETLLVFDGTNWQMQGQTGNTSAPVGSFNVLPNAPIIGSSVIIGAGTTFNIPAPSPIVDGDVIFLFASIAGASSETFTFPAGFSQVGSTLSSVGSGKLQIALACKVAASESGSYTVSWNNNTNTAVGWAVRGRNTSCTTDGIGTASGNASTLTATTFTPTITNDMLLIFSSQASSAINNVNVPGNVVKLVQASDTFVGYLPWGTGVSPSVKMAYSLSGSANANDSAFYVIALPSTTTSTTTPFIANSSAATGNVNSLTVANGVEVGGNIKAGSFLLPNGASCTSTSSTFNAISAGGNIEQLLCLNSAQALSLDAGGGLTFVSTAGGARNGPSFLLSNGALDGVSIDASQDLPMIDITSPNNDLVIGCKTSAPASLVTCASATQSNNMYLNVQTAKQIHIQNNETDRFTVGPTKNLTSGVAATIASIPLAADQTAGGTVSWSALATDTVNHLNCSTSGTVEYSAENSAGVFVVNTSVIGTSATACTATLTNACTFAMTSANPTLLQATCTLVNMASPTSYTITYNVNHLSGTVPTF